MAKWLKEQNQGGTEMGKGELEELKSIKKLLMLDLIKSGATSEELELATGMDAGGIRKMFPIRKIKKK